jgi:hypothetical protein
MILFSKSISHKVQEFMTIIMLVILLISPGSTFRYKGYMGTASFREQEADEACSILVSMFMDICFMCVYIVLTQ